MKESWKDIPGYDGKYQADMEGNIRRVYQSGKTRLMTPYHKKMSGSKRLVVKMTRDKKAKEEILVQIMAKTFLGNPLPGHVPYHKNGCQEDNYIQQPERPWKTYRENCQKTTCCQDRCVRGNRRSIFIRKGMCQKKLYELSDSHR